jgi:predicted nucleic acid-binding protein
MATVTRYLADPSVFARSRVDRVASVLEPLMTHGQLTTCGSIELGVLYSARSAEDYAALAQGRRVALGWLRTEDADVQRALGVQAELARRGRHRVAWPDLVVAAVAERHGVLLLHYHEDYELIAGVTGQPTAWVVPQGSMP